MESYIERYFPSDSNRYFRKKKGIFCLMLQVKNLFSINLASIHRNIYCK